MVSNAHNPLLLRNSNIELRQSSSFRIMTLRINSTNEQF